MKNSNLLKNHDKQSPKLKSHFYTSFFNKKNLNMSLKLEKRKNKWKKKKSEYLQP